MIDFNDYQKLKDKLEPIFVPIREEEEYCQKHKISRVKLSNGAQIVGIQRPVYDSVYASIQFKFSTGSYFDPPDKLGLHHLMEHMFNRKIRVLNQDKRGFDVNASTGSLALKENIGGQANIKYQDFGLWPVISQAVEMLKDPVGQYENPDEVLNGERQAVGKEIMERDSSQVRLAIDYITELIAGKENPFTANNLILGTNESIQTITTKDCRDLANNMLGSDNLLGSFITDVNSKTQKEIEARLIKELGNFPQRQKCGLTDHMLKEKVNPNFCSNSSYVHKTGLTDGQTVVFLFWLTESDPSATNYWAATSTVTNSLRNGFHLLSRKYGWSYSSDFTYLLPFWYRLIYFSMLIVPKASAEKLIAFTTDVEQKIKQELLPRFDRNIYQNILMEQKVQMLAQPITQTLRLDHLIEGIDDLEGRIIDPEKIRQQKLATRPEDALFWRDYLMETKPVVVVVGDLEE